MVWPPPPPSCSTLNNSQYGGTVNLFQFQQIQQRKIFEEDVALDLFLDVAHAVVYLHDCGVCHRDIKDENIIIDQDCTPRLTDYGTATLTNRRSTKGCGTIPFAAPEMLDAFGFSKAPPSDSTFDPRYDGSIADCFSMGMVLCVMLRGMKSVLQALGWNGRSTDEILERAGEGADADEGEDVCK